MSLSESVFDHMSRGINEKINQKTRSGTPHRSRGRRSGRRSTSSKRVATSSLWRTSRTALAARCRGRIVQPAVFGLPRDLDDFDDFR